MPKFTHHLFVCGNQRSADHPRGCCDSRGQDLLRGALKAAAKRLGCGRLVRVNRSGCLDQCELGPVVVIYPQGIWYGGVRPEDADRIIERTVLAGEILPDLLISEQALNPSPDGTV